jgi:methylated-DNA-protein-cysteine methyltransferase-like protein
MPELSRKEKILNTVRLVPPGKVASYGQIADLAGLPGKARLVGKTLGTSQDAEFPWHRVLRSSGQIAFPEGSQQAEEQRQRLTMEGIIVNALRVKMKEYQWHPDLTFLLHELTY